jgi:hypothetical protein
MVMRFVSVAVGASAETDRASTAGPPDCASVCCYEPAVWLIAAVMRLRISSGETSST